MRYAGFWARVVAYIIDVIPLGILGAIFAVGSFSTGGAAGAESVFGITDILSVVVGLAYFVGFESSKWQATPGKMALGLIVTDIEGRRISPARALGRYFGKILSSLILMIGFIMVAFTERKQGLHDILASTIVVKGKPGEVGFDPAVFE